MKGWSGNAGQFGVASAVGTIVEFAIIVGSINASQSVVNNNTGVSSQTLLTTGGIVAGVFLSLIGLGVGEGAGAIGGLMGRRPAAATRGDVLDRGAAGLPGLARPRPLLVHRPGGDLFGLVFLRAPLLEALFDVLVLTLALRVPRVLRHAAPPDRSCFLCIKDTGQRAQLP